MSGKHNHTTLPFLPYSYREKQIDNQLQICCRTLRNELARARYYSLDALHYSMIRQQHELKQIFLLEENLMIQADYPFASVHRQEHRFFLKQISAPLCRHDSSIPARAAICEILKLLRFL